MGSHVLKKLSKMKKLGGRGEKGIDRRTRFRVALTLRQNM